MEFDEILAVFGGTLYPDDYHMDFMTAEKSIETLDQKSIAPDTATRTVWIPLLRGLLCAATGDVRNSKEFFGRIETKDASILLQSRIDYYKYYCLLLAKFSPFLQLRQSIHSPMSTVNNARLEVSKRLRSRQLPPKDPDRLPISSAEFFATGVIESMLNSIYSGQRFHPAYAERVYPSERRPSGWSKYVEKQKEAGLGILASSLRSLDITSMFGYHEEAVADAKRLVVFHEEDCKGDPIGEGLIAMRRGDALLCPPFTSPLILNLIIEGPLDGWSMSGWDEKEGSFQLRRSTEADDFYGQAMNMFTKASCCRGQAAVRLRMGCIAISEGFHARSRGDKQQVARETADAKEHLQHACGLFDGDHNIRLITLAHRAILLILGGEYTEAISQASRIGEQCNELGNLATAQFIGVLFIRTARYLQTTHAATDDAVQYCRCARHCFETAKDDFFRFQAYLAEMSAFISIGDGSNALALLYDSNAVKNLACQHVLDLRSSCEGIERSHLQAIASSLSQTWDSRINAVRALVGKKIPVSEHSSSGSHNDRTAFLDFGREFRNADVSTQSIEQVFQHFLTVIDLPPAMVEEKMDDLKNDLEMKHACDQLENSRVRMESEHFRLLKEAKVEEAESAIHDFIEECRVTRAHSELAHNYVVAAYYGLGDISEAKTWLPGAISRHIGGLALPRPAYYQSGMFIRGPVAVDDLDCEHVSVSLGLVCMAEDWEMGNTILAIVRERRPSMLTTDQLPSHPERWKYMVQVAAILEHNEQPNEAFSWYLEALKDTEKVRSGSSDYASRLDMRATSWTRCLYDGLIRLCLDFADSQSGIASPADYDLQEKTWRNQSLVFLEKSLAGTLIDFLQFRANELFEETVQIERRCVELRSLSRTGLSESDKTRLRTDEERLEARGKEKDKVQAMIRADRPHFDTRMLFQSLSSGQIALCTWASREGTIVFAITKDGIQRVHRANNVRDIDLRNQSLRLFEALREIPSQKAHVNLKSKDISQVLVEPFKTLLNDKTHIIFVPCQVLQALPFSALCLDGKDIILTHGVSQAPSLQYLAKTKTRGLSVPLNACFVANPNTNNDTESPSPMAVICALAAARSWKVTAVHGGNINAQDFAEVFRNHDIVHVGTHGFRKGISPMQASIALKEELRVIDLVGLGTNASLIIFAACEAGFGQATVGNDILGFSHTVLQSGAHAYLAPLWKVSDWATMLLMRDFHRRLSSPDFDGSIVQAWRQAQNFFRNLTWKDRNHILREIKEQLSTYREQAPFKLEEMDMSYEIDKLLQDWEDEELSNGPFFWAPFVLIGSVS